MRDCDQKLFNLPMGERDFTSGDTCCRVPFSRSVKGRIRRLVLVECHASGQTFEFKRDLEEEKRYQIQTQIVLLLVHGGSYIHTRV